MSRDARHGRTVQKATGREGIVSWRDYGSEEEALKAHVANDIWESLLENCEMQLIYNRRWIRPSSGHVT